MSVKKKTISNGEQKWEVRLYESGRGSSRITRRFDRRSDAESFEQDFKEQLKKKKSDPFAGITFEDRTFHEEAHYWLEDGRHRFAESHVKRMDGVFKEILPKFGKLSIEKFTPELLGQFQRDEKKKGKANATVNRKTDAIMAILNHSVKHRRIPFNPGNGFRKLSKDHVEMCFWDSKEAASFLGCMNELYPSGSTHRWVYVAYLVALNTAMRAGEIWGLQPIDLNEDGETIMIRRQFNRVTNKLGPTKGKRMRTAPCPKALQTELRALIENSRVDKTQTNFRNEQGNPICHDNFTDRQFAKDLKRWGGRRIRFHDMRHTSTTLLIANGVDVKTVKEICGHADISTTMNYVHMISGSINKVAQSFAVLPETSAAVAQLKAI